MRNQKQGKIFFLIKFFKTFVNSLFGANINSAGRLVKKQNIRFVEYGGGNQNSLQFTRRKQADSPVQNMALYMVFVSFKTDKFQYLKERLLRIFRRRQLQKFFNGQREVI